MRSIRKPASPLAIQNIDTGGMHARTFTLDAQSGILIAANQNAVTKRHNGTDTRVPASLAVFRIGTDGKLSFVRKYDIETGQGRSLMWAGSRFVAVGIGIGDWGLVAEMER